MGCGPKSKCEDKKCVAVECRTNVDCKGKEGKDTWRCHDENSSEELQNTCYAVGCNKHDQCGAKKVCIDNVCESTECRTNADCPGNALCNRPNKKDPTQNSCQAVDCIGHNACKSHPNPLCQQGQCLCESNNCVAKTCVTSDHCNDKERCHNNVCVVAECSTHSHCAEAIPDNNGGFKPARAENTVFQNAEPSSAEPNQTATLLSLNSAMERPTHARQLNAEATLSAELNNFARPTFALTSNVPRTATAMLPTAKSAITTFASRSDASDTALAEHTNDVSNTSASIENVPLTSTAE